MITRFIVVSLNALANDVNNYDVGYFLTTLNFQTLEISVYQFDIFYILFRSTVQTLPFCYFEAVGALGINCDSNSLDAGINDESDIHLTRSKYKASSINYNVILSIPIGVDYQKVGENVDEHWTRLMVRVFRVVIVRKGYPISNNIGLSEATTEDDQ